MSWSNSSGLRILERWGRGRRKWEAWEKRWLEGLSGASLPSEISSGSLPPLAGGLRLPTPQKELGCGYTVRLQSQEQWREEGPALWGQGLGGGLKGKESGLHVASGFKQLYLEIEEISPENGRALACCPGLRNSKFLPTCDGSGGFVGRAEGRGHWREWTQPSNIFPG